MARETAIGGARRRGVGQPLDSLDYKRRDGDIPQILERIQQPSGLHVLMNRIMAVCPANDRTKAQQGPGCPPSSPVQGQ
jgi:hypothetical protein